MNCIRTITSVLSEEDVCSDRMLDETFALEADRDPLILIC